MFYKLLIYALLLFPLLDYIKIKAKFSPNLNHSGICSENRDNTIRKVIEALAGCKEEILVFFRDTYRVNPIFHLTGYAINNEDIEPKHTLVKCR